MIYIMMLLQLFAASSSIEGRVTDDLGEAVPFLNVALYQENDLIRAVETDLDGRYFIADLKSGAYNIVFSFIGFSTQKIEGVVLSNGEEKRVNAVMKEGITLDEITVASGCVRLFDVNEIGNKKISIRKDESQLPVKKANELTCLKSNAPIRTDINTKGSRDGASVYILDGLRVAGTLPNQANGNNTRMDFEMPDINEDFAVSLTAGEVNDFSKWALWEDISAKELSEYAKIWNIQPIYRYMVQIVDQLGRVVVNLKVTLLSEDDKVYWTARTDNFGRAELWLDLFQDQELMNAKIKTVYKGKEYSIDKAETINDGINRLEISRSCNTNDKIDIAFVMDATSSMNDEINFLKNDLKAVLDKVKTGLPEADIHVGNVFYKDHEDDYLTRHMDFTDDLRKSEAFVRKQDTRGGGYDWPEAVDEAFKIAVHKLSWRDEAQTKLLFLITDAPPHQHPDVQANLKSQIRAFAEKGIRVIPVVGSGINKSAEYFYRSIALATNGTYLFLTDDSGIGNSHIKPTTDSYEVEHLNNLLERIITQFSRVEECTTEYTDTLLQDSMKWSGFVDISENLAEKDNLTWRYFPNPTRGILNVEFSKSKGELFLADVTGKLLLRQVIQENQNSTMLDLSDFPSATYILKYRSQDDQWMAGKVVLISN